MNYYDCWTQIQWNLDITNLFLTKSSVWRTIFSPVLVKKRKRTSIWNLVYNTTKQILPAKRSELKSLNEVSLIKPWLLITANYVCKPIKIAINVTAQINRAERRERRNVVIKRGNSAVFAHFVKGIYAVRKKKCFDIHGWNCMELAAVLVEVFPNACASAFARSFFHRRKVLILDQFRVSHAVWTSALSDLEHQLCFRRYCRKKIPSELIFSASVLSFVTPSRPQISYKSWLERHHANVDLEECPMLVVSSTSPSISTSDE